jgi:hypothetical protein
MSQPELASEQPSTIRFRRLFYGVAALLAAAAAGRWLGATLASLIGAGADQLERGPSGVGFFVELVRIAAMAASGGLELVNLALPAVSVSIVIAFWTACANVVPDLIEFSRAMRGQWLELVKPGVGLAAATFTLGAITGIGKGSEVEIPEVAYIFAPSLSDVAAPPPGHELSYFAQLPVVYFPSGSVQAGKLTPKGSAIAVEYDEQLRRFVALLAPCASDSARPVRLEVMGFANQKPFHEPKRSFSEAQQTAFNVEQANQRATAVANRLKALPAQGQQFEIKTPPSTDAENVLRSAASAFAWIPPSVDETADFSRAAIVKVVDTGTCSAGDSAGSRSQVAAAGTGEAGR